MQLRDLIDIIRIPKITIHLMLEKTIDNDPFYTKLVKNYYAYVSSRHPKYFFIKRCEIGVAVCKLPPTFAEYFMQIESSARRNCRKAVRLGYETKIINYNSHLEDIRNIWLSTPIRQNKPLPQNIREGQVRPCENPSSNNQYHDYVYFGVFKKDKLLAYAGCLIIGELCDIHDIYGHDRYLSDGIVPLLIIEIAKTIYNSFPMVKYYNYSTYFGASKTMRRFKRKFLFEPHKVIWKLGLPNKNSNILIYLKDVIKFPTLEHLSNSEFFFITRRTGMAKYFWSWVKNFGLLRAIKIFLKILSGRRIFFGLRSGQLIVQYGWANIGFCRHYQVEPKSIVLGYLWTTEAQRGKGLAPAAISNVIHHLFNDGFTRFYIDTTIDNRSSQRMIEKSAFTLQK